MELLNKHVTVRKFQNKTVHSKLLESIIYSGARASTTGNMQLYSVIITQDAKMKTKLALLHFNQPVAVNAPVLLTFVADFNRFPNGAKSTKPNQDMRIFFHFSLLRLTHFWLLKMFV
jgi:nitroreductase